MRELLQQALEVFRIIFESTPPYREDSRGTFTDNAVSAVLDIEEKIKAALAQPVQPANFENGLTIEQELAYHRAQDGLLESAQQKVKQLTAELAEVQRPLDSQMARLNQRVTELNAERDAYKLDALRLDWLEITNQRGHYFGIFQGNVLTRAAIDEAIAKEAK